VNLRPKDCEEIRGVLKGKATGYRYSKVRGWLRRADFEVRKGARGSHRVWTHETGVRVMVKDDGNRPLLPAYPKKAAKVIIVVGGCPE
jgi:predicted RNA binding protein YcfA (HicA-like mRNA interferase family)